MASIFRTEFNQWLKDTIQAYDLKGHIIEIGGVLGYPLCFTKAQSMLNVNLGYSSRLSGEIIQIVGDFTQAGFLKDDFFDCVLAIFVLEHIRPGIQEDFIRQMIRIGKPGGHIIVAAPEKCLYHPAPMDGLRYTCDDLIRLFHPCKLLLHTTSEHVRRPTNQEEIHHFCLFEVRK